MGKHDADSMDLAGMSGAKPVAAREDLTPAFPGLLHFSGGLLETKILRL